MKKQPQNPQNNVRDLPSDGDNADVFAFADSSSSLPEHRAENSACQSDAAHLPVNFEEYGLEDGLDCSSFKI